MINYLKDCLKTTLIGLLPDIINSNNLAVKNEFNWIFDSSLNRLTKSVYAPTGSVKTHYGEFTNLSCEYLTIKNIDSLKATILTTVESIITSSISSDTSCVSILNHNILNNRFNDPSQFVNTDYKHDASAIVYRKENDSTYTTVHSALDTLENNIIYANSSINDTINDINEINTSIYNIFNDISILDSSIKTIETKLNISYDASMNEMNASLFRIASEIENIDSSIDSLILNTNNNYNLIVNVSTKVLNVSYNATREIDNINSSISVIKYVLDSSFGNVNSSINELKSNILITNSSINIINTSINVLNTSINKLDTSIVVINSSIRDIYSKLYLAKTIVDYNSIPSGQGMDLLVSPNTYTIIKNIDRNVTIHKNLLTEDSNLIYQFIIRIDNYIDGIINFYGFGTLYWASGNELPSILDSTYKYEITIIDECATYTVYTQTTTVL